MMPLTEGEKDVLVKLAANLVKFRNLRDMSMHELATKAGMEKSQIYRLEHAKVNPKFTTLTILCSALEISLNDLYQKED